MPGLFAKGGSAELFIDQCAFVAWSVRGTFANGHAIREIPIIHPRCSTISSDKLDSAIAGRAPTFIIVLFNFVAAAFRLAFEDKF